MVEIAGHCGLSKRDLGKEFRRFMGSRHAATVKISRHFAMEEEASHLFK
jgi:hypothetical protein